MFHKKCIFIVFRTLHWGKKICKWDCVQKIFIPAINKARLFKWRKQRRPFHYVYKGTDPFAGPFFVLWRSWVSPTGQRPSFLSSSNRDESPWPLRKIRELPLLNKRIAVTFQMNFYRTDKLKIYSSEGRGRLYWDNSPIKKKIALCN